MLRLLVLAVVVGCVLTWVGAGEVWLALWNGTQVEMTMADYIRTHPSGRWVKLTGCRVAYPRAVSIQKTYKGTRRFEDVSVPVYADSDTTRPVQVVLGVKNRGMMVATGAQLMGTRTETIEGVIRGGLFYKGMNPKLKEMANWKLADDYVIVDEGKRPDLAKGLGMLMVGMLALGFLAVMVIRKVRGV
ncbi:MAG TPA: hypothetical protein VF669_22055 [Tepidisphaeraceae bacterium]|jgi:hypothetical protein